MKNVIWKAYKLGDLFELTSSGTIALKTIPYLMITMKKELKLSRVQKITIISF